MTRKETTGPAHLAILVAIVLLGFGLRLYELDADSMWTDEIFTAQWAQLDLPTMFSRLASEEGQSFELPLTHTVTHFFVAGLGPSEFTLRLPALLAGSLSILLIYKVGEILWSRPAGLAAGFLLAVNPYHVQYSQEARHYALMVFLATMSTIFLVKAVQRNAPGLWLGFVLSTILGLYNHYFAFLFLPAQIALGAWLIAENWSSLRSSSHADVQNPRPSGPALATQVLALSLSLIVVGTAFLPWAHPLLTVTSTRGGSAGIGVSPAKVQSTLSFLGQILVSFAGVEGPALVLWLGAFAVGWARSRTAAVVLVAVTTAIPLMFLTLIEPKYPLIPKYVLFLLPLWLLLVATGLLSCADLVHGVLQSHSAERRWSPTLSRSLAILVLGTLSMAPLREYYHWDKEDWRDVATYLRDNMAPDDIVVSDGERYGQGRDSYRALEGLPYYFSLVGRQVTILEAQKGLAQDVQQLARPETGVWGVLYHEHELRSPNLLGGEVEVTEFPGVAVVSLREPRGDTMRDTASVLQALLLLQPSVVGPFDLHLALAGLYQEMGLPGEAEEQATFAGETAAQYERLAELDPTLLSPRWRWKAHWDLGTTYERLGMLREAADAYEKALRADPTLLEAHLKLGGVYLQLAEPANALSAFQSALDIDPASAQAHLLLGRTYQGLGRTEEAVREYRAVLSIDPHDQWTRRVVRLLPRSSDEAIPHPLLYSLGLKIALLGYDSSPETVEPGSAPDLTLWWQALAEMDKDYTAFIHLIGPDGRIWAQEDILLLDDQRPTSTWRLGQVVKGDLHLRIPGDLPSGEYTLMVGLYYWETGERLPAWEGDGHRLAGDIVPVQQVEVENPRD